MIKQELIICLFGGEGVSFSLESDVFHTSLKSDTHGAEWHRIFRGEGAFLDYDNGLRVANIYESMSEIENRRK